MNHLDADLTNALRRFNSIEGFILTTNVAMSCKQVSLHISSNNTSSIKSISIMQNCMYYCITIRAMCSSHRIALSWLFLCMMRWRSNWSRDLCVAISKCLYLTLEHCTLLYITLIAKTKHALKNPVSDLSESRCAVTL